MNTLTEDPPPPAAAARPVADWLAANGITPNAVPAWAPILVDTAAGTLTVRLYVLDEDGEVQRECGHPMTRPHTVPLAVPPDEHLLARLRREADRRQRRRRDLVAVAARLRAAILAEAEACEAVVPRGDAVHMLFVRGMRHAARVVEHVELAAAGS